jgi:hypothetical protein
VDTQPGDHLNVLLTQHPVGHDIVSDHGKKQRGHHSNR